MPKLRIGLMMGGLSGENYLSLRSAKQIFDHADRDKYELVCLEWKEDGSWVEYKPDSWTETASTYPGILDILAALSVDVVFVAFNGDKEGDGRLAGLFDILGIPYTGNGFFTCFTGMNKYVSKIMFKQMGLLTPEFTLVSTQDADRFEKELTWIHENLAFPVMVKPVASGSSIDLEYIESKDGLAPVLEELFSRYDSLLVEEYIKGRELSIGVYGADPGGLSVLPVAEIQYPSLYFDKQVKYNDQYTVVSPVELPDDLESRLKETGMAIHRVFGFTGLSRTDVIVGRDGVYVLEVNTHPGMGGHSIFPAMLRAGRVSYSTIIDTLITGAIHRKERGAAIKR